MRMTGNRQRGSRLLRFPHRSAAHCTGGDWFIREPTSTTLLRTRCGLSSCCTGWTTTIRITWVSASVLPSFKDGGSHRAEQRQCGHQLRGTGDREPERSDPTFRIPRVGNKRCARASRRPSSARWFGRSWRWSIMVGAKRQVVNHGKRPARLNDVTTVTVRDRNTGKVTSETFFGDSPFGK
jgi:hypothetical protein